MSRSRDIDQTPRTRESLSNDLRELGLATGDSVIVHSSLSSLGYVDGGAATVIKALMDVVTLDGAIVMPTQTTQLRHPTLAIEPVTDPDEVENQLNEMPVFDPSITPTARMGTVPELFRTLPGVVRADHPLYSFATWSRSGAEIAGTQRLKMSLGKGSALDHLYRRDGKVLLLGVGFIRCTTFHHAEYSVDATQTTRPLAPVTNAGRDAIEWQPVEEICFMDDDTIMRLGVAFESERGVMTGPVGSAEARLFSVREAVDYGVEWLTREYTANRVTTNCRD